MGRGRAVEVTVPIIVSLLVVGVAALAWVVARKRKFDSVVCLATEVQEEFYQELTRLTDDYGTECEGSEFDAAVDKAYFTRNLYMQILEDIENRYNGKKSKGLVRLK